MMMDNAGFASPRSSYDFPTGLRVLVVDDDLTWLKILEKMLKKCFYKVTTCYLARDALSILRERKDGFDIVISDVNMPDMDGFKLLEHIGLEMDLPVIMMSVDGETSRVMKGVQHGACDYLLKPIRMKELRNIWQHVLRKRINDVSVGDVENYEAMGIVSGKPDAGYYYINDMSATRKRKDVDNKHIESTELGDVFAKRARVVWTVDLHQKFVKAVKLTGIEKTGPKKILDSMNVPWLTRENVASHLQKYRLYLSRLQRDNGDKPFEISNHLDVDFCRVKHSDLLTKDPGEISFGVRETNTNKHMDADSGVSSSKMSYNGDLEVKDTTSKYFVLPVLKTEWNGRLYADAPDPQNKKVRHSESVESGAQFANLDSNIMSTYSWNGETRVDNYENVSKQHQHQCIDDGFNHCPEHPQLNIWKPSLSVNAGSLRSEKERMPITVQPDPPVSHLSPSPSANVFKSHLKRDTSGEVYPPYAEQGTRQNLVNGKAPLEHKFDKAFDGPYTSSLQHHTLASPVMPSPPDNFGAFSRETQTFCSVESKKPCTARALSSITDISSLQTVDTFRVQTEDHSLDHQSIKPIHSLIQNHKNGFELADSELALVAFGKDYKIQWDQSEGFSSCRHGSNETDLIASVPVHLYDALRFDYCDVAPANPMMDQSLSIVDTAHFSSTYYSVS